MAQYRRDVFNLAKGPGMAINDPREDEARAREASRRADQSLNMQRIDQAQRFMQVQRQADLQQEAMQTEAALAAQRQGPSSLINAAMAQAMRGQPTNQFPPQGRDATMRGANTARAVNTRMGMDPLGRMGDGVDLHKGGVTVHETGAGYGRNGATPSGGVMQGAFDRASGLFGDPADTNFQVAGRNLVAGEQKQAAEIADALARTGILKGESQSQIEARSNRAELDRLEFEETRRANRETERFRNEQAGYSREETLRARTLEEQARDQALSQEALQFIQTNMPGVFTNGEVDQDVRGMLAAVGASNPRLARKIAEIAQNPEAIRLVRDTGKSVFRSATPTSGLPFFGLESDQERMDAEEREYLRTLSRLGPGLTQRAAGTTMQDVLASERDSAQAQQEVRDYIAGLRPSSVPTAWWPPEKEARYQEWSRRPSAALDEALRQRNRPNPDSAWTGKARR